MNTWLTEHRFAISSAWERIKHQPWSLLLNVLVVGIALSLPLLGYTLLKNLQPLAGQLAKNPEISVFMSLNASRAEASALGPKLDALENVANARFVPREQALDRLKQQAGVGEMVGLLNQNPLPDAWVLQIKPDTPAAAQETLANRLKSLPKVDHVQIDSIWVRRTEALARVLQLGLTILATALGAAVVTVIFNTIRLQVLTQRDEIELAKLVGATNRYVRRPFYYLGTLQGLVGGAFALALVGGVLMPLNGALGDFARLYASDFQFRLPALEQISLFLLGAAGLGWMGAMLSTHRHLSQA